MTHTPTPWAIGSHNLRAIVKDAPDIADGCDHYMLAVTSAHSLVGQDEAAANAAFIVKAVNNHERLVKALEAVVHDVNEYERINRLAPTPGHVECWDCIARAKAVLADLIPPRHT